MNKKASASVLDTKKTRTSRHKRRASLALYVILFIISLTICLYFASNTVTRKKSVPVNYNQKGNTSYKVYLNKNNFYTEDYLDMNKSYVASLINYIDIDYNYAFSINQKTNMDFDYRIIGELVIENSKTGARYLEKEYLLQDVKTRKIVQDKALNIKENIKINYTYYNQLANSFKSTYGVETNSYLNVYLEVEPKTVGDLGYTIKEKQRIALSIPLSEKAIEINLNASNQNIDKQIVPTSEAMFSLLFLILEIILFIPTCMLLIKMIVKVFSGLEVDTPYDRYVNKKLKEYDRLIVESSSKLDTNGYNVINVKRFTELLDARDSLNLPIIYLNTIAHEEGIFYIMNNKDIYMLKVDNDSITGK